MVFKSLVSIFQFPLSLSHFLLDITPSLIFTYLSFWLDVYSHVARIHALIHMCKLSFFINIYGNTEHIFLNVAHSLLAQRTRIVLYPRHARLAMPNSPRLHTLKYELNSVHLSLVHCRRRRRLFLFSVFAVIFFDLLLLFHHSMSAIYTCSCFGMAWTMDDNALVLHVLYLYIYSAYIQLVLAWAFIIIIIICFRCFVVVGSFLVYFI